MLDFAFSSFFQFISTYPFQRAESIIPTLELLAFGVILSFLLDARMKLDVACPAVFGLVLRRKTPILRDGTQFDRDFGHVVN